MSARLFVGNLSYDVTESDLRDFFQPVGELSSVIIPMDRDTGKPRGFAFIEFEDQDQADEAVRTLNNQPLNGRNVAINEARARESSSRKGFGNRPPVRQSRSGFEGKHSSGAGREFDSLDSTQSLRPERRSRHFGGDAKPARKKRQRSGNRGDSGGRRGPIRERTGGQFFGNVEDEDDYEDDSDYKRRW